MENVSAVTSFILTAYAELEDHRYVYFISFLLLYILTLLANVALILVIYMEKGLHEPMYLFICNLAVNGVFGSTSLLPSMLAHLLSNYEVSLTCCLLQIYCLHTYASVEFTILAVMSYDRYVAICHPLHYHLLMSQRKVCILISISWIYPCVVFGLYFMLTVQLTFCDTVIEKVYCINFALVRQSCVDTSLHSIIGLVLSIIFLPGPQIVMLVVSYVHILRICLSASKESQTKAVQTCTPHLVTVVNYSVGCLFEVLQSRFKMSHVPYKARIFMSLYFLIIPPLSNPVIYGVSIQAIRVKILKLYNCKKRLTEK